MLCGYVQADALAKADSLFYNMPKRNIVLWIVMLDRLIQDGRIDDANRLFDKMPKKDAAQTSMITGYCQAGRTSEARELFYSVPRRNVISWTTMILGYAHNLRFDLARKL